MYSANLGALAHQLDRAYAKRGDTAEAKVGYQGFVTF